MPDTPFCDICPEAHLGFWGNGYSAWHKCWAAGHCMRARLGVDRPVQAIAADLRKEVRRA